MTNAHENVDPNENVDPSEIAKFEASAYRWWDLEGEYKLLHDINPLRLAYINKQISLRDKTVIDVGCGGGILAESMAKQGANVTGIDLGDTTLQVAKLHLLESQVEVAYHKSTVEDFAAKHANQYDVLTCMEMLEHVPDPSSIVTACAQLLKPNGHIFLSTINRTPKAYMFAVLGAEYILNLLPQGTHDYQKFIQPAELATWMRAAALQVHDFSGMHYNPVSKNFTLNDDITINYLAHGIKHNVAV